MRLAIVEVGGIQSVVLIRGQHFAQLDPVVRGDLMSLLSDDAALDAARRAVETLPLSAWQKLEGVRFALPVARPGKVVCLGLNYADHAREGGYDVPDYPALFLRCSTSLLAAGEAIIRPDVSDRLDYEAELMAIIGRRCRHVTEEAALDHVFGYTCFNDASVRDFQRKTHQWTPGKNFDSTGSIGPIVVTADELPRGATGLAISCRLNGQTVQNANTTDMIIPTAKAISLISEFMTLEPGDLVALGTPQGVGHARKPPLWMKPGDTVEVEIEGIATLTNPIAAEVRI